MPTGDAARGPGPPSQQSGCPSESSSTQGSRQPPPGSGEDCEPVICPGRGLTPLIAEEVKMLLKENGLQVGTPIMLPDMASAGNGENLNCFMETKKVLLNPFNTGGTDLGNVIWGQVLW